MAAKDLYHNEFMFEYADFQKDVQSHTVDINFFFNGIDTSLGHPAEAAFLNRSSSLNLSTNLYEDSNNKDESLAFELRTFTKRKDFFIDVHYDDMEFNGERSEYYALGFGKFMTETASIGFLGSKMKIGNDYELDRFIGNITLLSSSAFQYKLDFSLGLVNGTAPIVNASISDQEDVYDLFSEIEVSFYPSRSSSLKIGSSIYTRTLKSILVETGGDLEPTTDRDLLHYFMEYKFWNKNGSVGISYGEKKHDFFYDDFHYLSVSLSRYL
tara:strand:- start:848 stop:1654 length:807 start_codon:yes stop_codon:yes gene_type:complete